MTAKEPREGIDFRIGDDDYREAAEQQRAYLREIADRIERGAPLTGLEPKTAAAALRRVAADLPSEQPRSRGRPAEIDRGSVALEFMALTKRPIDPLTGLAAFVALAEKYGVSEETIRNAVRDYGTEAATWFDPDK